MEDDWQELPEEVEDWEEIEDPNQSPVTTATTGLMNVTVPFAAPIAGAGKAAMNLVTGVTPPGQGTLDDYRHGRDEFQGAAKSSAEANPDLATGVSIGGALTNPLFRGVKTGVGLMKAGATQALGMSDADLTKGEVGKATGDTVTGALGAGAGFGAAKASPFVGRAIDAGIRSPIVPKLAAAGAGMAAGGMTHGPMGAIAGAALGNSFAKQAGEKVANKLVESYIKAGNSAVFKQFAPVLEKAAARGPEALSATSAILSQNPEFQQILQSL